MNSEESFRFICLFCCNQNLLLESVDESKPRSKLVLIVIWSVGDESVGDESVGDESVAFVVGVVFDLRGEEWREWNWSGREEKVFNESSFTREPLLCLIGEDYKLFSELTFYIQSLLSVFVENGRESHFGFKLKPHELHFTSLLELRGDAASESVQVDFVAHFLWGK